MGLYSSSVEKRERREREERERKVKIEGKFGHSMQGVRKLGGKEGRGTRKKIPVTFCAISGDTSLINVTDTPYSVTPDRDDTANEKHSDLKEAEEREKRMAFGRAKSQMEGGTKSGSFWGKEQRETPP
jgi:hypothetical protein